MVWCPEHYTAHKDVKFHVADPLKRTEAEGDEDRLEGEWDHIKESKKFMTARRGDHLMVHFECDLCVHRKLKQRDPDWQNPTDVWIMNIIRRMQLDAFWSRATRTVVRNAQAAQAVLDQCTRLEMRPPFGDTGPLDPDDYCGYTVAVLMIDSSTAPGRYSPEYKQFETIRVIRTVVANQYSTTIQAVLDHLALANETGRNKMFISRSPLDTHWFTRWVVGCRKRMGEDWRPDRAISPELLQAVLKMFEKRIREASEVNEQCDLVFGGTYCALCYVEALRGHEGLLLDLKGLIAHWGTEPGAVVIPLRGKVKGETHERAHLLYSVYVTDSGIQMQQWLYRTIKVNETRGRVSGPAFASLDGKPWRTAAMKKMFDTILIEVFEQGGRHLFPTDIDSAELIIESYDVFRSFRRGANSRAMSRQVPEADVNAVLRWVKIEASGGLRPGMSMAQYYADPALLIPNFLRFTQAM